MVSKFKFSDLKVRLPAALIFTIIFVMFRGTLVLASNGEATIKIIPSGGNPILVSLEAAKLSNTINAMIEDLGGSSKEDLPLPNLERPILNVVFDVLTQIHEVETSKEDYGFHLLRAKIKESINKHSSLNHNHVLQLLLAANYLDIQVLLRPTAAIYVDLLIEGNVHKSKELQQLSEELSQSLIKDNIPKELFPFFLSYLNSLFNPPKPIKTIQVHWGQKLSATGNKLNVLTHSEPNSSISVIDMSTDSIVDHIELAGNVQTYSIVGEKLYYIRANDEERFSRFFDLFMRDLKTGQTVKVLGKMNIHNLTTVGAKLYICNVYDNTILVIDTTTDQLMSQPIHLEMNPAHIYAIKDKLYVGNFENTVILVIDTNTDKVIDLIGAGVYSAWLTIQMSKIMGRGHALFLPNPLTAFGFKLFALNLDDGNIYTLNTKTDKIVGQPIPVGIGNGASLCGVGNLLFVNNSLDRLPTVIVINTSSQQIVGRLLVNIPLEVHCSIEKLYVSTKKSIEVYQLSDFYYYN